ncbi:hypothetical protein DPMN_159976 [Dreissena polymorpha]|uniref:Uncharacterized protein n=1 Tax=Dreissena polymorpha TaxID=45954 RepID=A0A9D4ELH5_DREPO|nr:hypothetical protein DPMN_159976 [Dreissena polymorpha]
MRESGFPTWPDLRSGWGSRCVVKLGLRGTSRPSVTGQGRHQADHLAETSGGRILVAVERTDTPRNRGSE